MPREDRRIIFDVSEIYQAIYKLSVKSEDIKKPIAGSIIRIEENEDNGLEIKFHIVNPQTNEKRTMIYTRDFVAAALMMFCRGAGIPLPRKSSKTIIIEEHQIILRAYV
jgi:hypothetical protein